MRRLIAICIAALAASAGLAMSQASGQQVPSVANSTPRGQVVDGVVATVNDEVITHSDVRNRMRWILLTFPGQADEQVLREVQERAIETLIDEKVQLQEFRELVKDQEISEGEVDEAIARLARQNRMTPEQFLTGIRQAGVSVQSLRDQMKAEIAWSALINGRYRRQVRVSELRVDEMYERIKASLDQPQYLLAEIFLYAPDQASRANALSRAQTLIEQINQGAQFEAVAQQFSAAPSASAGGDLGWLTQGDMRPEVEAVVTKAETVPAILPPLETDNGVYIIAVRGKRDPTGPDAASLDLKQVVARGDGAADMLAQVKAKAKTCEEVAGAIEGLEGVIAADMNDISLQQVADQYRSALQPLEAGQSSEALDLPTGDGKMVFYVCERISGDPDLPSREQLRARLQDAELSLIADRYLRDLKREASIDRR